MTVKALVLSGYGLNCDAETAHAFTMAGAEAQRVHINALINKEVRLADFQIMAFIGGFSWGDDHGAGVVQAVRMKTRLGNDLRDFVKQGKLVIGICNGFQTLVNVGLLPGINGDYVSREVALLHNDCGNFRDHWVHLQANAKSPCVFTKGMDKLMLPIRHGEGKFYAEPSVLAKLEQNQQIALTYTQSDFTPAEGAFPANPNGSLLDIAGICDQSGHVFGLMPHPEAYLFATNHPLWTKNYENAKRENKADFFATDTVGAQIFINAVNFFK